MGGTGKGRIKRGRMKLSIVQLGLASGLFVLDILFPSGTADGIGYSAVLVLCLWNPKRWYVLLWMAIAIALVIGGGIVSGDDGMGGPALINRTLAIATIMTVGLLVRAQTGLIVALRRSELEARQASEAKSAFLANMSHELRTPLNAIIGFSDLLSTNSVRIAENKRAEYVHDIHTSANHLLSLINDILDLVRIGAGRLEMHEEIFSADELVVEALRMTSIAAKQKQLIVDANIAPHLPHLRADRRLVKQVLINLLANAVKFTKDRGGIAIEVGLSDAGLRFAVSDTGIGIPAADIGRPFARAANAATHAVSGTGLGLALCREYMEMHGGTLKIRSVEGKGTTVEIAFPNIRVVVASSRDTLAA